MVSKPLLWPFLRSIVFISWLLSTLLPPSQQPSQPFAVEFPTSSSRPPRVPDLQLSSLRCFTLHRPLSFASLLQILLRLRFWRYRRDRLAPIYKLMKVSTLSETTCAPTRRSKVLFRWSRAPRFITLGHAPSCAPTRLLTSLLTSSTSALACIVADDTCLRQPLMSSFDSGHLIVDFSRLTIDFDRAVDFDSWLFSQGWLFQSRFFLHSFSRKFHFCSLCLHIVSLNR